MNKGIGRATIKSVALEAGVSTQTVSRVINERPDVSVETRKRVQQVIERLGYRPSALARSLIQQRSYTLGVVTAGLRFIGPSRILSGITAEAEQAGYALMLKELPRFDAEQIEPIFEALLSRHVDGIIWAVPEVGENRAWIHSGMPDLETPIVFLTMEPQENISVVAVNNYMGGKLAVNHLMEQGCRHIAHISGPLDWWEARQRMAAWRDSLREAGMEASEAHWSEGNWSAASGVQAFEKLCQQFPEMDSIFVANDQMALSVMQVLHQKGRRVPQDISIVGFDNISESAYYWPPLTTIQQDQYEVARIAVQQMIKLIESGREGQEPIQHGSVMLEPTLVVRQSSMKYQEVKQSQG